LLSFEVHPAGFATISINRHNSTISLRVPQLPIQFKGCCGTLTRRDYSPSSTMWQACAGRML
jgi:hypothetical protein